MRQRWGRPVGAGPLEFGVTVVDSVAEAVPVRNWMSVLFAGFGPQS